MSGSGEAATRQAAFEAAFQATRDTAEKEIALLERIENAVLERQRTDGAGLAKAAGRRFQKIEDVMPEFDAERESLGDDRLNITIRANADDYKVLFTTPMCGTVRFMRPELLDPRRFDEGIGCRAFGAWNEGGAQF